MELGLSDAEFWRLTPREMAALTEAAYEVERRAAIRALAGPAEVWALIANMLRKKGARRARASDLFPILDGKPPQQSKRQKSLEEMLGIIEMLKQVVGSKEIPHD